MVVGWWVVVAIGLEALGPWLALREAAGDRGSCEEGETNRGGSEKQTAVLFLGARPRGWGYNSCPTPPLVLKSNYV